MTPSTRKNVTKLVYSIALSHALLRPIWPAIVLNPRVASFWLFSLPTLIWHEARGWNSPPDPLGMMKKSASKQLFFSKPHRLWLSIETFWPKQVFQCFFKRKTVDALNVEKWGRHRQLFSCFRFFQTQKIFFFSTFEDTKKPPRIKEYRLKIKVGGGVGKKVCWRMIFSIFPGDDEVLHLPSYGFFLPAVVCSLTYTSRPERPRERRRGKKRPILLHHSAH